MELWEPREARSKLSDRSGPWLASALLASVLLWVALGWLVLTLLG